MSSCFHCSCGVDVKKPTYYSVLITQHISLFCLNFFLSFPCTRPTQARRGTRRIGCDECHTRRSLRVGESEIKVVRRGGVQVRGVVKVVHGLKREVAEPQSKKRPLPLGSIGTTQRGRGGCSRRRDACF